MADDLESRVSKLEQAFRSMASVFSRFADEKDTTADGDDTGQVPPEGPPAGSTTH